MAKSTPRNRLSTEDKKIIRASKKSDLELAAELNVFSGLVTAYRMELSSKDIQDSNKDKYKDILSRLHRKLEWRTITEKFNEREVEFFEEKYCELSTQFNGEIYPTEEMQIIQLIQMDILINRNMTQRKRLTKIIDDLNDQIVGLQSMQEPDVDNITKLHDKMASYYISMNATVEELNKYQQRHSALLKDLKATRDQRLDKIESNKRDYISLIKMLDDNERRSAEQREMQIMKAAAQKQRETLSQYHSYADGTVSQPVLCADTIKDDNLIIEDEVAEDPIIPSN